MTEKAPCTTPSRYHPRRCAGPRTRRSRRSPPPQHSVGPFVTDRAAGTSGATLSTNRRFNERHPATAQPRLHSPLTTRDVRGTSRVVRPRGRLLHEFVIVAVRQVRRRRLLIAADGVLHGPRRCAVPLAGHEHVSIELLHPQMPERCVAEEVFLATVSQTPGTYARVRRRRNDGHMKDVPTSMLGLA